MTTTYSKCSEFRLDSDGKLFQALGFPDPEYHYVGRIYQIDPDDAPERIRPAIVELVAEWADRESRDQWYAELRKDYQLAVLD